VTVEGWTAAEVVLSAAVEGEHNPSSPYLSEAMAVLSDCSMCSSFGEVLKSEY
jgi:hypothetical protein